MFSNLSPFPNAFPSIPNYQPIVHPIPAQPPQPNLSIPVPPEQNLPRCLNYLADYSGCGQLRMCMPSHLLNAHQKLTVHDSTVMCFDANYFRNVKSVRIQRQATPQQLQFVRFLKELQKQIGFRLLFEIDDIMFSEDIPDYNKFKVAFVPEEIRKTAQEIMSLCDEITVTCNFMKEYYSGKTGNNRVTVIPNYFPKWWIGNFYDEKKISENYDKFQKKPRILYAGSGAHFDVDNKVGQKDDFQHVCEVIVKTRDKFQWVFLGAFPLPLQPFIQSKQFEYHPWEQFYRYPEKIAKLNINACIAPLQDNVFNRAKSDLKYIEACNYGLPIACQDICTYENAPFRFKTGDEMIGLLEDILSKKGRYMNLSAKARQVASTRWLETDENIDKYVELYTLPYGDPGRKLLNSLNNI
jgi:hypothetical protein